MAGAKKFLGLPPFSFLGAGKGDLTAKEGFLQLASFFSRPTVAMERGGFPCQKGGGGGGEGTRVDMRLYDAFVEVFPPSVVHTLRLKCHNFPPFGRRR